MRGIQQVHCSGARQLQRVPRLKKYLSICYKQTRNNVAKLIPVIKLVWPKTGFRNWSTCTLRVSFANLKGTFKINNTREKYIYTSFISNYLYR